MCFFFFFFWTDSRVWQKKNKNVKKESVKEDVRDIFLWELSFSFEVSFTLDVGFELEEDDVWCDFSAIEMLRKLFKIVMNAFNLIFIKFYKLLTYFWNLNFSASIICVIFCLQMPKVLNNYKLRFKNITNELTHAQTEYLECNVISKIIPNIRVFYAFLISLSTN